MRSLKRAGGPKPENSRQLPALDAPDDPLDFEDINLNDKEQNVKVEKAHKLSGTRRFLSNFLPRKWVLRHDLIYPCVCWDGIEPAPLHNLGGRHRILEASVKVIFELSQFVRLESVNASHGTSGAVSSGQVARTRLSIIGAQADDDTMNFELVRAGDKFIDDLAKHCNHAVFIINQLSGVFRNAVMNDEKVSNRRSHWISKNVNFDHARIHSKLEELTGIADAVGTLMISGLGKALVEELSQNPGAARIKQMVESLPRVFRNDIEVFDADVKYLIKSLNIKAELDRGIFLKESFMTKETLFSLIFFVLGAASAAFAVRHKHQVIAYSVIQAIIMVYVLVPKIVPERVLAGISRTFRLNETRFHQEHFNVSRTFAMSGDMEAVPQLQLCPLPFQTDFENAALRARWKELRASLGHVGQASQNSEIIPCESPLNQYLDVSLAIVAAKSREKSLERHEKIAARQDLINQGDQIIWDRQRFMVYDHEILMDGDQEVIDQHRVWIEYHHGIAKYSHEITTDHENIARDHQDMILNYQTTSEAHQSMVNNHEKAREFEEQIIRQHEEIMNRYRYVYESLEWTEDDEPPIIRAYKLSIMGHGNLMRSHQLFMESQKDMIESQQEILKSQQVTMGTQEDMGKDPKGADGSSEKPSEIWRQAIDESDLIIKQVLSNFLDHAKFSLVALQKYTHGLEQKNKDFLNHLASSTTGNERGPEIISIWERHLTQLGNCKNDLALDEFTRDVYKKLWEFFNTEKDLVNEHASLVNEYIKNINQASQRAGTAMQCEKDGNVALYYSLFSVWVGVFLLFLSDQLESGWGELAFWIPYGFGGLLLFFTLGFILQGCLKYRDKTNKVLGTLFHSP